MSKGTKNGTLDYRRKNNVKRVRTVFQFVVLLILATVLVRAVVDIKRYEEPDRAAWTNTKGFVALSYFGVSRSGTSELIAKNKLDQQLKVLYEQGYRTISQQDVIDFYKKGKALPDKALFLAFEDGRNDSSLYAQPILERYNFKATISTYANKAGDKDPKFLQPGDLLNMTKNGFWELGSNGYRLTYINILDKEGRLIGVKDETEFTDKNNVQFYNHYLMDFIRDENGIPTEHKAEMEKRINADYKAMKEVYNRTLGYIPGVYMIMHANSLYHGMNPLVANVNGTNIRDMFKLHYNREGDAYNGREDNPYDLTRVQPAPYWYTNHLLMKLRMDTGQPVDFVRGDESRSEPWTTLSGAAEFVDNRIALTSAPENIGLLYLKGSESLKDVKLTVDLTGDVIGKQSVYVRCDQRKDAYVKVSIQDGETVVEQKAPGRHAELLFTTAEYDVQQIVSRLVHQQQKKAIELVVQGDKLTVKVDGEVVLNERRIDSALSSGGVALESEYSTINKRDVIYDSVFDDLKVVSIRPKGAGETTIYDNGLTGLRWLFSQIKNAFNGAVDWAIDTF